MIVLVGLGTFQGELLMPIRIITTMLGTRQVGKFNFMAIMLCSMNVL